MRVYLFIHFSLSDNMSVYLSVYLYIYLSIYLSICISLNPSLVNIIKSRSESPLPCHSGISLYRQGGGACKGAEGGREGAGVFNKGC